MILEGPKREVIAIEVKRSSSPKVTKGFHLASEDIKATKKFVIYSGQDRFQLTDDTEVISLNTFLSELDKEDVITVESCAQSSMSYARLMRAIKIVFNGFE